MDFKKITYSFRRRLKKGNLYFFVEKRQYFESKVFINIEGIFGEDSEERKEGGNE